MPINFYRGTLIPENLCRYTDRSIAVNDSSLRAQK